MSVHGQFRTKSTDIDNTVPAISEWPNEKLRNYRYTDLDGNRVLLNPSEFKQFDTWPMPKPIDREGYAKEENSDRYWVSGLADWQNVSKAIERYLKTGRTVRLLDFGCASGRFLRHPLTQPSDKQVDLWGCDLAPANIAWIKRHLPPELNCVANSSKVRLPYDDNYFDFVTAFSVFTHINESEIDWLEELLRVIKCGGILYLTIHNEASWEQVPNRTSTKRMFELQNTFEENLKVDERMFEEAMPKERIVFRKDWEDVYNCNVWHSDSYIRREWGKHAEILQIANCAHLNFQTPVILRAK